MRLTIKGGLQSRAANNRVNTVCVVMNSCNKLFSNIWVWVDNELKFALLKNKCEQYYSFHFIVVDVLCTLGSIRLIK